MHAYLDNNATTQPAPEVLEAVRPFLTEFWGNPSSTSSFAGRAQHAVERAREQLAALLRCQPAEIVFTSGGSESINTALLSAVEASPQRKHLVTSRVEHGVSLGLMRELARRGWRLTELGVDRNGRLDLEELRRAVSGETALVSLIWANNETGTIFPVQEAAEIARQAGALVHLDAVQCPGKLAIDLGSLAAVDLLSISGHKFHALKGTGALFVRKGHRLKPLISGGTQERGLRAGTENVPGIVSLGAAAELVGRDLEAACARMAALRDRLAQGLLRACDDVVINGDEPSRLCNTLNMSFAYIEGEAVLMMLDAAGISASSGSACASGSLEPSHVLRAMDVPFTAIHGSVRFSVSRLTTEAEIDHALEQVPRIVRRLREISPFGRRAPQARKSLAPQPRELEQAMAWFAAR